VAAKSKRFVVVADSHGDMLDPEVAKALFAFLEDWKPEIRVHAGDAWDFRNLRRGAHDDEKAASLVDDWEAGTDFLTRFFAGGTENHFLRGNHDERLWMFARSATGLLRDYAHDGIKRVEALMRKCKARMLPYDAAAGVLRLGELRVVHGYHAGIGAARAHASVYRNVIFGHTHTIETSAIASLEPCEARSIGCLCMRDMDYINAKTGKLRWGQGWASGILHGNGTYTLNQIRKIDGRFVAPVSFKTY
jgi:predicted phosphodiesterase